MLPATNGKPVRHAPFAQETAQACAPADSHRLPVPPGALPYGEHYAALIANEQSALVDAVIEHAVGPAADALLERIEARFDAIDARLVALERRIFGDLEDARDHGRPQPRRPDSPPAPPSEMPEDDPVPDPLQPPDSDPGPAQTPPDADDPSGEVIRQEFIR